MIFYYFYLKVATVIELPNEDHVVLPELNAVKNAFTLQNDPLELIDDYEVMELHLSFFAPTLLIVPMILAVSITGPILRLQGFVDCSLIIVAQLT